MILKSTLKPTSPNPLTSPFSSSYSLISSHGSPPSILSFPLTKTHKSNTSISISCSTSKVQNFKTRDYEKRPMLNWNSIFKRISLVEDPQLGVSSVLNQCENGGKTFSKWELCRIVKELRKFGKFKQALEVYKWMHNRIEMFKISSSDTAIQVDLIAKVHGIPSAEDYFTRVPDTLKDMRLYGALLNAYVGAKIRDKAETLMEQMRNKGYCITPLPYNVMMTLYMKLDELDKVEELVSEMKQKKISLDSYSYNIWLSARGSQGSPESMEQVFQEMDLDPRIIPNWTTFSTMASMYAKLGQLEKAEQCLRNLETRITNRDRMPYHYLLSLYGSLGNRGEVYRVWNIYKSVFPNIPNWGYHSVISSLVRSGDIEGAEKLYEEWLPVKSSFDPKIGNLLMGWYVKEEPFEKVKGFFDHMTEAGGKPNASSWEILGEAHIKEGRINEALACFKESVTAEGGIKWKPKLSNVNAFFELCDQEADQASKEDFVALLIQIGCLQDGNYSSFLTGYGDTIVGSTDKRVISDSISETENENKGIESEDPDMLLSAT
ncbi:pentatricopeptide repeat-containing protein At1g02150-like [Silene latifolia]